MTIVIPPEIDIQEANEELKIITEAEQDAIYVDNRKWAEFADFIASNNETDNEEVRGRFTSSASYL